MPFQYRIKTKRAEEGEYSEYQACDKATILNIIDLYWKNDTTPNGLHVISILNESGESLLLEHFEKDVFDVYYLPRPRGYHYHKKSKQVIIYDCLDYFFEAQIDKLKAYLNYTKKDDSFIRDEFFFADHFYRIKPDKSRQTLLITMLMCLPIGGTFTFFAFALFWIGMLPTTIMGFIVLLIGTFYWLPGLLLHLSYEKDGANFIIKVTRDSGVISLQYQGKTNVFDKSEIELATQCINPATRNPWSEYGYLEIKFKSGTIVNITNLMVDQFVILDKFRFDEYVPVKKKYKVIPRLVNKSVII